ncbi:Hypp4890 [Branchiostoma lanceolatum]|uniref:Hypp4890 protein n=1 Tax=Branchiostoma lanceolatum TaxID=7740 RepID=A0A8K0AAZ2_BRALA|nr:Hypp4890 [Branchiostoma lanceolatum]
MPSTDSIRDFCPCKLCNCTKLLSWRTIREHVKTNGHFSEDSDEDCDANPDFLKSLRHNGRDRPLHSGSSLTLFQAIMILLGLQSQFPGVSQAFMTALFRVLKTHFLPADNILPRSYVEAKSIAEPLLTPIEKDQTCRNKCIVYDAENQHLDSCPKCHAPRSSKFAFPYIPIIPRIRRWMSIPEIAKTIQTHLPQVHSDNEQMTDIQQSPAWKRFTDRMGGDTRCIAFGLNTDGVDPFNHLHVQYSMWPIMLKVFNFPPEIRDRFEWIMLVGIIPGSDTPSDMNPFMRKLVNELLELEKGVIMWDGFRQEEFTMKAEVLVTITDLPGGNKLHKTANSGALLNACWICDQQGQTVSTYHRVLYLDSERFLSNSPPQLKTKEQVHGYGRAVQDLLDNMEEDDPAKKKALAQMQKSTGKKGLEELARLSYYDPVCRRPPEVMHGSTVMLKKMFGASNCHVNPLKTLEQEQSLGRFTSNADTTTVHDYSDPTGPGKRKAGGHGGGQKKANSHPPWALDKEGMVIADKRCLHIQVPHGFGWKVKEFVRKPGYMKSHEWMKIGTHGVLKYVLHGLLGPLQQQSLFKFLDCLTVMCSKQISTVEANQLEINTHKAMAGLEHHWPLYINTIMKHMMQHVASYLKDYGPVPSIWMFGFERFNTFIVKRIMKRDTPEVNCMETYRVFDLALLLEAMGYLPPGALITDPVAQLQAVTDARREFGAQPMTTKANRYEDEDFSQPTEDPEEDLEEDSEEDLDQEDQEDISSFTEGCSMLTSQFRKPEEVQLTDNEVALIADVTGTDPSNVPREATRHFAARLQHPRSQVLTCALTDNPATNTCSSYFGMLSESGTPQNRVKDLSGESVYVNFGRVLYYIRISLGMQQDYTELAMMQWLATPVMRDGLWMVESNGSACHAPSFVPCQVLSPPLVTARDTSSPDTPLFFLDASASTMPRAPLK